MLGGLIANRKRGKPRLSLSALFQILIISYVKFGMYGNVTVMGWEVSAMLLWAPCSELLLQYGAGKEVRNSWMSLPLLFRLRTTGKKRVPVPKKGHDAAHQSAKRVTPVLITDREKKDLIPEVRNNRREIINSHFKFLFLVRVWLYVFIHLTMYQLGYTKRSGWMFLYLIPTKIVFILIKNYI